MVPLMLRYTRYNSTSTPEGRKLNCVAKLLVFLVLVAKLNCSGTFVFIKLSDRSHLILQNVVPAKFLWAVLTSRRAVSADVSMGCKTHPSGSSRGQHSQQRRLQQLSLAPYNQSASNSSTGVNTSGKTSQFPMQTLRNRKMLPNHLPFYSVLNFSTKLQAPRETL